MNKKQRKGLLDFTYSFEQNKPSRDGRTRIRQGVIEINFNAPSASYMHAKQEISFI